MCFAISAYNLNSKEGITVPNSTIHVILLCYCCSYHHHHHQIQPAVRSGLKLVASTLTARPLCLVKIEEYNRREY